LVLRFVCGKYPKVPVTLPLKPTFLFFLRIIFKIPAVPLASNFDEGLVITSIFRSDLPEYSAKHWLRHQFPEEQKVFR
jgi:hypothetical protein